MGRQKTAKGQITLITVPETTSYELSPSATQIIIDTDGNPSPATIYCTAYKNEGNTHQVITTGASIKYKYTGQNQYQNYNNSTGVTINTSWQVITFFLFLDGQNDPIVRFDVPIIRNGQVDTNFRVWVGTTNADPNTLDHYPWYNVEGESQDPSMHIGDYYVTTEMTYYCFQYQTEFSPNPNSPAIPVQYIWDQVTDATLLRWLERTNESTRGYFVPYTTSEAYLTEHPDANDPESNDFNTYMAAVKYDADTFFQDVDYIIGDLWADAKYTVEDQNHNWSWLYNNEPMICRYTKGNRSFSIEDWKPASDVKSKLKNTGIDLDEGVITVTADEIWYVNNGNERAAIFNLEDGHPKVNTDLLRIDGHVQIDGGLIVQSLGSSDESQEALLGLLSDKNILPTVVTHNNDGTITIQQGNNTVAAYTKSAIDNSDFVQFDVTNGSGNSTFTLNKNGLLEADNAVIYGEIHATKGSFEGTLQSAGGAFSVDLEGNVKATSFNGTGILMSGTTIITKDNFYDYFSQSQLDINNGSTLDDGYNAPFNKRWIPNLKKIQNNIYFESLPQEVLFFPDGGNIPYLLIVMPHYFYEYNTIRTGSDVLRKSCRRGDLTYQEMCQLDGRVYTFQQKQDPDMNIIILTTLFTNNYDCGDYFVLTSNVRTGASEQDFAQIKYQICHNINGTSYYGGIYSKLQTRVDQGFLSQWSDIDEDENVTVTNNQQPDVPINGDSEYNINIYFVSRSGNTFCFRWECSSIVNIEGIGTLALPGYYITVTQENGQNVYSYVMDVVQGQVVYGQLVSGAIQYGTDGQYQSGYLCITANKEIDQSFKFANISLQHTSGNIIYNIKV